MIAYKMPGVRLLAKHAAMRAPWWVLPVGAASLSVIFSLLVSGVAGFPLDDSWIHQDFARTLATAGRFAFAPDRSGAGSTSPLWVVLLTPPQLLFHGNPPTWVLVGWAAAIGGTALAGTAILAGVAARAIATSLGHGARVRWLAGVVAGVAVAWEWHLDWAAVSGMETVLFALMVLVLMLAALRGYGPVKLGLLAAVAVYVRPEAVFAALLIAGAQLWSAAGGRQDMRLERLRAWGVRWLAPYVATWLIGCLPYVALNLAASGHVLPSTFYAKSSFYGAANYVVAAWQDLAGLAVDLIGSSPVLLLLAALSYSQRLLTAADSRPGRPRWTEIPKHSGILGVIRRLRTPKAEASAAETFPLRGVLWAWVCGLTLVYLGRGVATFHHSRYLMPVIPEVIALMSVGAAVLVLDRRRWLLGLAGALLLAFGAVFSMVRGAQIFSDNVRFIDGVQVASADWLRQHAAPNAVIATHDIGAIQYFSHHKILDIAGLVDPQVIPLLRDQTTLEAYLRERHVAYVVMFTTWFPPPAVLAHDLAAHVVYRAPAQATFVVYRTGW